MRPYIANCNSRVIAVAIYNRDWRAQDLLISPLFYTVKVFRIKAKTDCEDGLTVNYSLNSAILHLIAKSIKAWIYLNPPRIWATKITDPESCSNEFIMHLAWLIYYFPFTREYFKLFLVLHNQQRWSTIVKRISDYDAS